MSRAAADLARAAKAFPALLTIGFAEVVAYRAEFLVWVLTTNMPLVMLALWHAVAEDGAVGRFDQPKFTAYYLAVLIVRLVTSNWMAWQMSMEVRDGTLSAKLLRPIHPLYAYAADHISAIPMRLLYVSPIVVVLLVTSWRQIAGHDPRLAWIISRSSIITVITFAKPDICDAMRVFSSSSCPDRASNSDETTMALRGLRRS